MEKLTLTRVFRKDEVSKKTGNPYTRLALKTKEYGEEKWVSGFGNKSNSDWKVGDVIEVDVKQEGQYLNFEMPKSNGASPELIAKVNQILENTVTILNKISGGNDLKDCPPDLQEPDELSSEVPF